MIYEGESITDFKIEKERDRDQHLKEHKEKLETKLHRNCSVRKCFICQFSEEK